MHEVARVTLENEMDLILAHKRSMKLAELSGLSLSAQTTFATAVSEVSRSAIENGQNSCLILNVDSDRREKYIVACLKNEYSRTAHFPGLEYAKRLVNKYEVSTKGAETAIELFYYIAPPFRIDVQKLDEWRSLFRNEPPVSPYEELKRKNAQLQELSDKVQKSETQYKVLTNTLPLGIFSIDIKGELLYANHWLMHYTGASIEQLNATKWKGVIYEADYEPFSQLLKEQIRQGVTTAKIQTRLKNAYSGEALWHQVSLSPVKNEAGEVQYWIGYMVDINAQKVVEETLQANVALKQAQAKLKEQQAVQEKYIAELNRSNLELQQFAFVASHDLQEPVRKVLFYSDYLLNQFKGAVDAKGQAYLHSMQLAAQRMRNLIQDLLLFSQINKNGLHFKPVDLNEVAGEAQQVFEMAIEEKHAHITVAALPTIYGDRRMMKQLFENLISNALKYARQDSPPVIEISMRPSNEGIELAFKDNGIGFDEKYLPRMFMLFQRLHTRQTHAGTGLGLAICQKITELHHGKIWAQSKEGEGAVFYVWLPLQPEPIQH